MEFATAVRTNYSMLDAIAVLNLARSFIYFRYLMGSRGFGLDVIVALVIASINLLDVIAAITIASKFAISLCFAII